MESFSYDFPMSSKNLLSTDNHLLQLARRGRLRLPKSTSDSGHRLVDRLLYPIAVAIYGIMAPILAGLCLLPLLPILLLTQDSESLQASILGASSNPILLVIVFAPLFLLVWLWLWLFEQRPPWTTGLEWPRWLAKYMRGLLVGLLMFSAAIAILALFGALKRDTTGTSGLSALTIGSVIIVFGGWMVQGAAEELLTRGFVLPVFGVRFGAIVGILVSSMLFMILHLLNSNISPIALLNLFLFGVFAALFALFEGGLWGIFAIHSIWNWAQGNLFGFEVSGSDVGPAVIVNLSETGPDWLTGGPFGPEGGLAVTLVLVTSSFIVWFAYGRTKGQENSPVLENTT